MTIPSSVQLLGINVPVVVKANPGKKAKNTTGTSFHITKHIEVYTDCRKQLIPIQVQEHTFFHELVHQILNSANYNELNDDEQFVDVISGLLHQALSPHMK